MFELRFLCAQLCTAVHNTPEGLCCMQQLVIRRLYMSTGKQRLPMHILYQPCTRQVHGDTSVRVPEPAIDEKGLKCI